jgi:hypothetical protein
MLLEAHVLKLKRIVFVYSSIGCLKTAQWPSCLEPRCHLLLFALLREPEQIQSHLQCWETNLNQSISSISGGHIMSPQSDDYIVQTFGGAILVFSNSNNAAAGALLGQGSPVDSTAEAAELAAAALARKKAEVTHLEAELVKLQSDLLVRSTWYQPLLLAFLKGLMHDSQLPMGAVTSRTPS